MLVKLDFDLSRNWQQEYYSKREMGCQKLDWDCSAYSVSRLYQYFDPHHQNHADSGESRDTNVP